MPGKIALIFSILSLSCTATSAAETAVEDDILSCAAMADDGSRLECFDRVAELLKPAAVEEPASQPAEPAIARQPDVEAAPEAAPAAAAASAPAAATASAPAAAADPVAEFGMNPELRAKQADGTAAEELKEITALVVAIAKRPRGEHVVTLDNGQVWSEKSADPFFRIKVGDSIRIKRSRMGGYRMVGRGNRATAVVRTE